MPKSTRKQRKHHKKGGVIVMPKYFEPPTHGTRKQADKRYKKRAALTSARMEFDRLKSLVGPNEPSTGIARDAVERRRVLQEHKQYLDYLENKNKSSPIPLSDNPKRRRRRSSPSRKRRRSSPSRKRRRRRSSPSRKRRRRSSRNDIRPMWRN